MKKKVEVIDINMRDFAGLYLQHPELDIIPMVDEEIVASNEFSRWMASIGKSRVDEYYMDDERMYFKTDIDELEEKYSEDIWLDDEEISDARLEKLVKKEIEKIPWKRAIFVNIDLP